MLEFPWSLPLLVRRYMPRGTVHQAESTAASHSLHLTISTGQRNTMADFLQMALPRALEVRELVWMPPCLMPYWLMPPWSREAYKCQTLGRARHSAEPDIGQNRAGRLFPPPGEAPGPT